MYLRLGKSEHRNVHQLTANRLLIKNIVKLARLIRIAHLRPRSATVHLIELILDNDGIAQTKFNPPPPIAPVNQ